MFETVKANVRNWESESEVSDVLWDILQKKKGDGTGLIYGMGHAVYTLSDPRAVILRDNAEKLADKKGMRDEFELLKKIEQLTPVVMAEKKGSSKDMCANVDLYSGFVYRMLGIPQELFTPLFATARMSGWCAHRLEEYSTCSRIMRPAYKNVVKKRTYLPIDER